MKTKIFQSILGASVLALVTIISLHKNDQGLFTDGDNIAFASGYTCAPKLWKGCAFGAGHLYDYIKVASSGGIDSIEDHTNNE